MSEEKNSCKKETFDRLYRSISPSLQNFLFFKCGDEARAFDLSQEAFVKLWRHCKKVPPSKAKAYVYTVAKNLFLNTVAHQKVVFSFKKNKSERIDEQSPQYLLEEKEFGERLNTAIANLTEVQRTAFLMNRVEGKKYREIAELLGISEKAAGKRISDALENLRRSLENI